MAAARLLAARLGSDIVFLDLATSRLIYLEKEAAGVWDACPPADCAECGASPRTRAILARLERAGVLDGRHHRRLVEWT